MYVDAYFLKEKSTEIIKLVERVNGVRVYKDIKPDHHYYVEDPRGTYRSFTNKPLIKITPKSSVEKMSALRSISGNIKTWETDIDPVFRCLEENYKGAETPKLNIAFFDIETSYDPKYGWSEPEVATNYITSISIYLQWSETMVCLAIPPKSMDWEEANRIANEVGDTVLFEKEIDMLSTFLDVIEDADVLSGWNSAGYDIPYVVNRIKRVMGKQEARRMCLWGKEPRKREFDFGGKTKETYDLYGRVHLDYLELYKKYTYEERQSFTLNSIAEYELGETKVQYDGTLDALYNDDFKMFLEYNIQDTRLLDLLDKKLKFIELANTMAHDNCVLIQTTMGTVAMVDQAVVIECHSLGMIAPDKKHSKEEDSRAAGAWVADPRKGLQMWVASTDMKSLYPSVIRTLNMSPETIIGQINLTNLDNTISEFIKKGGTKHTTAAWWNDKFNIPEMDLVYAQDISEKIVLDMESGESYEVTGAQIHDIVFESGQPWCISANGTIFRTDKAGVVPSLLTRWYSDRKKLQAIKTSFEVLTKEGIPLPEDLLELSNE